jgi:hypothetical protein
MASKQIVSMLQKQRSKLESRVAGAEKSLAGLKGQVDCLDIAISALGGTGRMGGRGRKRGQAGLPPTWWLEQQKAELGVKQTSKAATAKTKKKVSPKVLAGLTRARAALAKQRAAAKK